MEGADNRFKDIRARHHTLENTILVVHQSHVDRRIAQDRNDISCIEGFWYYWSFSHQISELRGLARQVHVEQIFCIHDAQGSFMIAIKDNETRVLAVQEISEYLDIAICQVDRVDLVTRGHYRPYGEIAKSHHPGNHFLFARF